MAVGYEAFFGLRERPFSLTTDAKYFFASRSHAEALAALKRGFHAGDRFLLVTGDLGVGKTVVCRTLVDELRATSRLALIGNPLISPEAFNRLLVEELALPAHDPLETSTEHALIIIDEAQTIPAALVEHVLALSRRHIASQYLFRFAFVGQSAAGDPERLGIAEIDDRVGKSVRLLPLGREECAAYVEHRLTIAGPDRHVSFSAKAHDDVFAVSGGLPRLINLLCERALQEAAALGSRKIEASTIHAASATLQLLRARARRFRRHRTRSG